MKTSKRNNFLFSTLKFKILTFSLFFLSIMISTSSCRQSSESLDSSLLSSDNSKISNKIFSDKYVKKHSSSKWNKNDETFKNSLQQFSNSINNRVPLPEEGDLYPINYVEYGYYDDPEDLIIEGPYVAAASSTEEAAFHNNATILNQIEESKNYLNAEGYSDIVSMFDNGDDKVKIIYAATILLDLKKQMQDAGVDTTNARAFNCALQAIGYTAVAELATNWALASRAVMLRAIGAVAARYAGWIGAAIMVGSFADCMWG